MGAALEPGDALQDANAAVPDIKITRLEEVTALMADWGWQYGDSLVPAPPLQPLEFCT
jgi:hypothetical protein